MSVNEHITQSRIYSGISTFEIEVPEYIRDCVIL